MPSYAMADKFSRHQYVLPGLVILVLSGKQVPARCAWSPDGTQPVVQKDLSELVFYEVEQVPAATGRSSLRLLLQGGK